MDKREQILETIHSYLEAAMIDKDVEKASVYLAEEIVCCDLNVSHFLISKESVVKNLHEKVGYNVPNRSIAYKEENVNLYGQMAVYLGKLTIKTNHVSQMLRADIQYSATLRYEDGWKICAGHYSVEEEESGKTWGFVESNIAGGILSSYVDGGKFPFRYINENLLNLLGYSYEEFQEKYQDDVLRIVYPDDFDKVRETVASCMEQGGDWRVNHRVETKDGKILHMLVRGRKSLDRTGREIVTNFSVDMTDLYLLQEEVAIQAEELEAQNEELMAQEGQLVAQAEALEAQNEELIAQTDELMKKSRDLVLSEKKFRIALAKTNNIIFDYNILEGTVLLYNLSDPAKDKVILLENLPDELIEGERICEEGKKAFEDMFLDIKNGDMSIKKDIQTFTQEGMVKWHHFSITAVFDAEGEPIHAIGTAEDITMQKREELDLRYKAESDLLTGIYNKVSVMEKIEEKLILNTGIQGGAFIILDVDCFKKINDAYGHPCGDEILKKVADILKCNFRETDIIGRLGGDEFGIYIDQNRNIHFIRHKAEVINREVREILHPGGGQEKITVSIGITTCNGVKKDFEQVYKEADNALYRAKQKGRDTFCFYED